MRIPAQAQTLTFPAVDANDPAENKTRTGAESFGAPFNYYIDNGSANAYAIATSPAIDSLSPGFSACFIARHGNTTRSTLAVNSVSPVVIQPYGASLTLGQIRARQLMCVQYDGTKFEMRGTSHDARSRHMRSSIQIYVGLAAGAKASA